MTPPLFLATSILMGLFMTAGGIWAALYCLSRARHSPHIMRAALGFYGVAVLLAISLAVFTPLELKWKLLLLGSGLAYAFIPPITLRYLETLHEEEIHL